MSKTLLLLLIAAGMGCKDKPDYCKNEFPHEYINFMTQGKFLSNDNRTWVTIIHRVDPKSIESFMYFTGDGWSANEDEGVTVLETDSCTIKNAYFNYIKRGN